MSELCCYCNKPITGSFSLDNQPGKPLAFAHVECVPGATPAPDATGLRDSDSLLASATDLLNSWARESSVREAETPEGIVGVIDRLWSALSVRLHATPAQPSRAQIERIDRALQAGTTRYSRDRGEPEPTLSFPVEVVFTMSQWDAVLRALAAQPTPEQEEKR